MDWVWNQSTAKGTARLVLLAIADKAYGKDCSAYAGTTMLVQRCNAARSSVIAAVDKLIKTGELAVIEGRVGPRGETFYKLPKATRHRRSEQERGPDSVPPTNQEDAESAPKSQHHSRSDREGGPKSGPVQNPDRSGFRTGTDSGPGGSEIRTPGGPKSGPHNGSNTNTNYPSPPAAAERSAQDSSENRIPRAFDYIQPLIKAMTEAGITVTWQMPADDIQAIAQVQQRAGVDQMITFARNIKARTREPITFATYFLKAGWRGLAPAAAPQQRNPRQASKPPHCGHLDCDEESRLFDPDPYDNKSGLIKCPNCHPDNAKGHQAA